MPPTALRHRLRALSYLDEADFAALDDLLKHREDASPGPPETRDLLER